MTTESGETTEGLREWLDGQEFHELCMDYRGAPPVHAQYAFIRLQVAIEVATMALPAGVGPLDVHRAAT